MKAQLASHQAEPLGLTGRLRCIDETNTKASESSGAEVLKLQHNIDESNKQAGQVSPGNMSLRTQLHSSQTLVADLEDRLRRTPKGNSTSFPEQIKTLLKPNYNI